MSTQDKSANTRPLCEDHSATWFKCRCCWNRTAGGGKIGMIKGALCGLVQDVFNCVIVGVKIVFVEARSICLESINFLAIINEVAPSRAEIEAISIAAKKMKDMVRFIFWWRSTNEGVRCEWRGRGLVGVVMQVGSYVRMEGVVFVEVIWSCTKHRISHGAWCRSQSLCPTWCWSKKYLTLVLQLFLWVGTFRKTQLLITLLLLPGRQWLGLVQEVGWRQME